MNMCRSIQLKQFLNDTIHHWDHDGIPPNVRDNFWKIINCGTAALGAEVSPPRPNIESFITPANRAFAPPAEAQSRVAKRAQQQIDVSARAGVATSLDLQVADQNLFQAQSSAAQARANVDIRRSEVAAAEGRLYTDVAK